MSRISNSPKLTKLADPGRGGEYVLCEGRTNFAYATCRLRSGKLRCGDIFFREGGLRSRVLIQS